jgi:DNA helicase-2/ATP-dependent DNA helicase PcrA
MAELARKAMIGKVVTAKEINEILDSSFYLPFAGLIAREKLKAAIIRRTQAYLAKYVKELDRTTGIEVPFSFPVTGARIFGRIDLMLSTLNGNKDDLILIDFKTSAIQPKINTNEDQLNIYAQAISKLGKNPRELYIHDLGIDGGRRIKVDYDQNRADLFQKKLERWVSDINNKVFTTPNSKHQCSRCDYKLICRRRSI